ncbi:bifunctional biotin--[acetyl-CoA-carboxylase] ligase/biotin operon repressor BirA [Simiduia sp. 21SJ11W-1]|uniref:bifunctional biotin--[acetyl-CoA-carboxylase] ligase/biotin operon repressor BirA n=1 Tax=Simiduia sp. 21SJ11W-1 TaxID=2909669 RepID=UPI00209D6B20|nr:bifunctional biotin--[acetyl-CoA-carboxylase] ligase/biotin operon repressor BirA [Simiduia sp. 21SJ11W-1]UTA47439.1 bifunctional biotin--[acetyl-CoA-carboxylase] ligase/biotin operon repressor BirA [Simiduia sp. 21SJ11W-1]
MTGDLSNLGSLLVALADGEFHSGEVLGTLLGVSRAAVWKQLQKLEAFGLAVESVKGRGYRLATPLDLLAEPAIRAAMSEAARKQVTLDLALQIDSTNAYAMRAAAQGQVHGLAVLVEQQSAGRGRRGRQWVSPFGANIYLSLVWRFAGGAASLSGLSLAVGVACARALTALGLPGVGLKWPNDLLVNGHKLGGILLEMTGDPAGECQVVIGIGINVGMGRQQAAGIDQPWTSVQAQGVQVPRSRLAAELLSQLVQVLAEFSIKGFAGLRAEWAALDVYKDAPVTLLSVSQSVAGVARGVDDGGALLLETEGGIQAFHGGEVSVRARK